MRCKIKTSIAQEQQPGNLAISIGNGESFHITSNSIYGLNLHSPKNTFPPIVLIFALFEVKTPNASKPNSTMESFYTLQ